MNRKNARLDHGLGKFINNRFRAALIGVFALAGFGVLSAGAAHAGACNGTETFCDDFNGPSIDTNKWIVGNLNIANKYPVRPANIALTTINDNGTNITVVDSKAFGDNSATGRQGGVIITKNQYGGGRYEVRMRNLLDRNGCSCIWNYYDSLNETNPPPTRVYTEIDMEMPAHMNPPPTWSAWKHYVGLNTWSHTDSDADATYINYNSTINPFDAQFHVYRFDWRDGANGTLKIDWYIDGVLQASTTQHVSNHPAQLWVGNWPAPWPGMWYTFDTQHMYIDWVKITPLS